jgi:hypothetical protein
MGGLVRRRTLENHIKNTGEGYVISLRSSACLSIWAYMPALYNDVPETLRIAAIHEALIVACGGSCLQFNS